MDGAIWESNIYMLYLHTYMESWFAVLELHHTLGSLTKLLEFLVVSPTD